MFLPSQRDAKTEINTQQTNITVIPVTLSILTRGKNTTKTTGTENIGTS